MLKATYVSRDGRAVEVSVPAGTNLMQAAVQSGVTGIIGECGGNLMCATCHVYISPVSDVDVTEASSDENEMLNCVAAELRPESRLSCQLVMSPPMSGIVLDLPEEQM
jgi:2Fe-2S ferredoxin